MADQERAVFCDHCRLGIPPGHQVYTMRVDLFAEARPPEIDDIDLAMATGEAWEKLIAEMEAMDDAQVAEERDKVHERFQYTLCPQCREQFHRILGGIKP